MNSGAEGGGGGGGGGGLEGFYAYKDTFDADDVWVEVPKASQTLRRGLGWKIGWD